MLLASNVASAAPSAAPPVENISLCDRVTVAMENSKSGAETDLPNLDFTGRSEPVSNGSP